MAYETTRSEALLDTLNWYQNLDAIRDIAGRLEQQHTNPIDLHRGPITDLCRASECAGCQSVFGALIEYAARMLRRDNSTTMFDVLRTPVYRNMIESISRTASFMTQNDSLGCLTEVAEMAVVGSHVAHGLRTYEVSEGLLERLKLTGLQGIPDEDVRLPFASTYFQFNRGMLRLQATADRLVDVTGVLLREFQKTYAGLGSAPKRMVELSLFGKRSFEPDAPEFMVFSIELQMGVAWQDRFDGFVKLDASGDTGGDFSPFQSFMPAFWELMVNIILYATWPEAGQREEVVHNPVAAKLIEQVKKHQKGTHKHERAKDALKRTPHYRRIVLGRTVSALPPAPAGGDPLKVRTLVQGHWMRVAVGPGKPNERKDRKWIFREPFWRGPEGADEGSNRYRLT